MHLKKNTWRLKSSQVLNMGGISILVEIDITGISLTKVYTVLVEFEPLSTSRSWNQLISSGFFFKCVSMESMRKEIIIGFNKDSIGIDYVKIGLIQYQILTVGKASGINFPWQCRIPSSDLAQPLEGHLFRFGGGYNSPVEEKMFWRVGPSQWKEWGGFSSNLLPFKVLFSECVLSLNHQNIQTPLEMKWCRFFTQPVVAYYYLIIKPPDRSDLPDLHPTGTLFSDTNKHNTLNTSSSVTSQRIPASGYQFCCGKVIL